MSILLNKANTEAQANCKGQFQYQQSLRKQHENIANNNWKNAGESLAANQAALIPTDAYRELDQITQRVFKSDEGQGYMMDLMKVSKSLDVGKTAYVYRQASDKNDQVVRSLSGNVTTIKSKTDYTFQGDPVPIFRTDYGRPWRELRSFQSEGFDAMFDDHENAMREIKEDMSIYLLNGDTGINVQTYNARGILNHAATQQLNLGSSGANIDLTSPSTSADNIIQYFTRTFANELDNNYCPMVDVLWISPQIGRRLAEPYSDSGEFKEGTLRDYLLKFGRIKDIQITFELGRSVSAGSGDYNAANQGNEFFAYVRDQQVLCPLVGQGVSTVAIPRLLPMDDINNLVWSAMGFQVRADSNGRSKVFHASNMG